MVSIIHNMLICGTVLILALMILISLPKSMMRSTLLEVGGWIGVGLAALYVVCPVDFLPDWIPIVGWIDDAGAIIGGITSAALAISARGGRKQLQKADGLQKADQ
jgi:uncharacterized membrane protein YkvA (DUF1232 family)